MHNMTVWVYLLISFIYNIYVIIDNKDIPKSLSQTAYDNNKELFTFYCFSNILLFPPLLNTISNNLQFLAFLMIGGMMIAGASRAFKFGLSRPVHYISSYISFIAFILFLILETSIIFILSYISILLILILIRKDSYTYFAEILALIFISVYILIN